MQPAALKFYVHHAVLKWKNDTDVIVKWRLVKKMARRAAKFHLWLNMLQDCRPGFYN